MSVLVGLDVGTTGVKALAVTPDGEVVGREERPYPLSTPRPGWSEQDPEDWWAAARGALEALSRHGIAAIGLSGQMHGLVALDDSRRVLRPAILWNDARTGEECREIEERIGLERLVRLTGNRALAGFTAPKLLWMRTHEPELYGRIAHVLLPKDYVRLRLTGELRHRRLGRLGDAAPGRGRPALERGGGRGPGHPARVAPGRPRVAGGERHDGRRRPRGSRRGRPGRGCPGRGRGGRARPAVGGPRDVGGGLRRAARRTRRTRWRAPTPSATPSPAGGTSWA